MRRRQKYLFASSRIAPRRRKHAVISKRSILAEKLDDETKRLARAYMQCVSHNKRDAIEWARYAVEGDDYELYNGTWDMVELVKDWVDEGLIPDETLNIYKEPDYPYVAEVYEEYYSDDEEELEYSDDDLYDFWESEGLKDNDRYTVIDYDKLAQDVSYDFYWCTDDEGIVIIRM